MQRIGGKIISSTKKEGIVVQKNLITLTICITLILVSFAKETHAQEASESHFHPSRVRLILHAGHELSDTLDLRGRFIPAANLLKEVSPISYLGLKIKPVKGLAIEPNVGWFFPNDEPLTSLTLTYKHKWFIGLSQLDYRPISKTGYWFAMADVPINKWFKMGVEAESWGKYGEAKSWTHGGGPNLLLRYGKAGTDLAMHARELKNELKPEFSLRFHVFLQ